MSQFLPTILVSLSLFPIPAPKISVIFIMLLKWGMHILVKISVKLQSDTFDNYHETISFFESERKHGGTCSNCFLQFLFKGWRLGFSNLQFSLEK